jgi:hypothetical protein
MTLGSSVSTLNLQFVSLEMGRMLSKLSKVVMLLTYIREVPDTEYPD